MSTTQLNVKKKDDSKTGSNRPLSESSAALRYYRGTEHARHDTWPTAAVQHPFQVSGHRCAVHHRSASPPSDAYIFYYPSPSFFHFQQPSPRFEGDFAFKVPIIKTRILTPMQIDNKTSFGLIIFIKRRNYNNRRKTFQVGNTWLLFVETGSGCHEIGWHIYLVVGLICLN